MIARNGKYGVVAVGTRGRLTFSSSRRIRGSQRDDSHEDCHPDPRHPCDNWHFEKIRKVLRGESNDSYEDHYPDSQDPRDCDGDSLIPPPISCFRGGDDTSFSSYFLLV